ncbi:putative sugar phosphate/phosphate translocator [Arachis hypogaea]|nr:putative sugar phosphate/phosphate translocator [Arachis hypogaea]
MENDGKESYKDGDQSEDLSVEYECSSDKSDDIVDHEKDIGSTLKGTIGEESIGQLLMSTVGRGFDSFVTIERFPVLTTCLESFEKQAAELYTRNIFILVKDEIEVAGALNVTKCPNSGNIIEYNTSEYFNQQWVFKVSYNKDKDLFVCECRLFETRGLPCSHIFGVLKHRNAKCVPTSLILKRWTRDAKSDFICSIGEQDTADDIVPTLRCGAMASICWKLCDISSKNSADYRKISGELLKLISKVQNKSDAQARLSPTSALIGDPAVVKSKGDPRKVPKGQKRRRCSHCKSSRHFVRTCPLLAKEDSPVEYSNAKDEPMTEEITLTQETLKDKTNTSGIEVTEVPDASTTKIPKLSQYPMHHYPVVLPYQPYGGVLPIPLHPVPNGMAYFNQYPSTAAVDDKQNKAITAASNELAKRKSDLEEKLKLSHDLKVAVLYFHDKFTWVKGLGLCTILFGVSLFNWYKYLKIQKGHFGEGEVEVLHTTDSTGKYVILEEMD